MEPFNTTLLDLTHEMNGHDIPLIIGGGFGLFLMHNWIIAGKHQILFERLPDPRSTNDIDLFLRAELLADSNRIKILAAAVAKIGFLPVDEAKYFQWKKEVKIGKVPFNIKLDILVGPLDTFESNIKVSNFRARPKGDLDGYKLHARKTDEAVAVEENLKQIPISGLRSTGESSACVVFVPQSFSFLVMKLHAFEDRKQDPDKDMGRHHAMDLYRIVGMMTREDYQETKQLSITHRDQAHVIQARQIVDANFKSRSLLGAIRLQEHKQYQTDFELDRFLDIMKELFPAP